MTASTDVLLGFDAHPDALADLDRLPPTVHEAAVSHLRLLVRAQNRGTGIDRRGLRDLTGCRKVCLDEDKRWRLVYQERPPASSRAAEIYLLAAGPRSGHEVYNTAARRLHLISTASPQRS
ncbi:hypothetical protein ACFVVU_30720 [Kitasatospora sp. NPDC057965]|uniref:hypothetical protein n=1 Tax=Kitasatospora sp. NPDC057965 TaxID=3346291 RepID=UPI0036D7F7D4